MLLHYQIWICISGHSKFNMDWNLTFYTGIQNSKFHDPLKIQLPIKIRLSDPPANTFLKFLTPLPPSRWRGCMPRELVFHISDNVISIFIQN